jgi:hypothetical protein
MTDRELLELAAKAAGYLNWTPSASGLHIETGSHKGSSGFYWNPLIDDADAFRLAVKLRMDLMLYSTTKSAFIKGQQYAEKEGNDPYAATRRAIVRAAAEIGRRME